LLPSCFPPRIEIDFLLLKLLYEMVLLKALYLCPFNIELLYGDIIEMIFKKKVDNLIQNCMTSILLVTHLYHCFNWDSQNDFIFQRTSGLSVNCFNATLKELTDKPEYGAFVVKISRLKCKRTKLNSIQGENQERYTAPTKYSFNVTLK
jgi:hypothetical protein